MKEFCRDRCRAAFADEQKQAAIRHVRLVVEDCQGDLARHQVRLDAALTLLERLVTKHRQPTEKK